MQLGGSDAVVGVVVGVVVPVVVFAVAGAATPVGASTVLLAGEEEYVVVPGPDLHRWYHLQPWYLRYFHYFHGTMYHFRFRCHHQVGVPLF